MKRKITLSISIALVLSIVLVALTSSDSRVAAQNQIRIVVDTGMVPLGPNQILRITVSPAGGNYTVAFRQTRYGQPTCSGGVCTSAVVSQSATNPIPLMPNEAASIDIDATEFQHGVRGVVLSNRRNVRVTAAIIDTVTGEPISTSLLETMQEDECGL